MGSFLYDIALVVGDEDNIICVYDIFHSNSHRMAIETIKFWENLKQFGTKFWRINTLECANIQKKLSENVIYWAQRFLKINTFSNKSLIYREILMYILFQNFLKLFIFLDLRLLFGPFGIWTDQKVHIRCSMNIPWTDQKVATCIIEVLHLCFVR